MLIYLFFSFLSHLLFSVSDKETNSSIFRQRFDISVLISRGDLLCSAECQLKVVFALGRGQTIIVKLCGEERVDEGTERHAVTPARGEVLNVDVLQERDKQLYFTLHWDFAPYHSTQSDSPKYT